jgi:hypothetical protein
MILTSTGVSDSTLVGLEPTRRAHSSGLSFAPIVNLSNKGGGNCRSQHSTTHPVNTPPSLNIMTLGTTADTFAKTRESRPNLEAEGKQNLGRLFYSQYLIF